MGDNFGIQVSGGGQINAAAVAVGANSHAVAAAEERLTRLAADEAKRRLQELLAALEAHGTELAEHDEVLRATGSVVEELGKERPNRLTLRGLLSGIASAAEGVGAISAAAVALSAAIGLVT